MPSLGDAFENAGASPFHGHLRRFNQNIIQHRAIGNLFHVGDSNAAPHKRSDFTSMRSPARECRERGLGDRDAVERVAPWMGLPEVAA